MVSASRDTRPSGCYLGLDACYPNLMLKNAAASRTCSHASQPPASLARLQRQGVLIRRLQVWTQSPRQDRHPYQAKSLPMHRYPAKIFPRIPCPAKDHSRFQRRLSNAPSLLPQHPRPPQRRAKRHSKASSNQNPWRSVHPQSLLQTRQSPVSLPAMMEHHHLQRPLPIRVS